MTTERKGNWIFENGKIINRTIHKNADPSFEDLKGFEELYQINPQGEIFSCCYGTIMKSYQNEDGYLCLNLKQINKKNNKRFIHRLIAIQYIPNPDNLAEVDHIDRNKLNNSIDNLRWVSRENNRANRETKGCITTFQANGKTNYKASYAIEKGKIKQKSSIDRNVVEVWLENIKKEYPRL